MDHRSALLPRISVNRPVTVAMCLVALLLVGIMAYFRVPVKFFPSGFTPAFLYVDIEYNHRNASPQEAEQQIARPLEEQLRAVKGIKKIRTYSASYGVDAPIEFQPDTDMVLAYNQVIDRLERLKLELPEEVRDQVYVYKFNADSWEIMWAGVSLDPSIADPYKFLNLHVKRRLERIEGVGRVSFWGVDEKEVMIELSHERLMTRGVDLGTVVQALRSDNFALSVGHVREGGKRFFVRSLAKYQSVDEIKNILIRRPRGEVRLGDVSDVVYDVPGRSWYQRIDGQAAASIGIFQESGANIVEVCERVTAALQEIENDPIVGEQIVFNVFFNQGEYINDSIRNLETTGLWGGLFAAMVLLFFLRTVRMTAIITLSIPLCVMITITALYFLGWSLNVLTMMGLMVGVGMVVDNAIVILENIYRMRAQGTARQRCSHRRCWRSRVGDHHGNVDNRCRIFATDADERQCRTDLFPRAHWCAGCGRTCWIALCRTHFYSSGGIALWQFQCQSRSRDNSTHAPLLRTHAKLDTRTSARCIFDRSRPSRKHQLSNERTQARRFRRQHAQ